MQKAKLGISVGLLGAAIYLTALSGSLLGLLVLAGYVLLVEDNQWLRLSAVKAVAVYLFFTFGHSGRGLCAGRAGHHQRRWQSVQRLHQRACAERYRDPGQRSDLPGREDLPDGFGRESAEPGHRGVPFVDKLVVKYL